MTAPAAPSAKDKPAARCVGKGAMMLRCSGAVLTGLLAKRFGYPIVVAGGAVAVLAGASMPMLASGFSVAMVAALGFVGAFVLMTVGGVMGTRAAEAMPAPAPAAGGCGGCSCACCGSMQQQ